MRRPGIGDQGLRRLIDPGLRRPAEAYNTGDELDGTRALMAAISFLIALLLGGAAFLFKQAADQISVGTSWAGDVCSTSQLFCHHPQYLAYAGGVMLIIAIGTKLGSLAN
jgi:hypothetical protein